MQKNILTFLFAIFLTLLISRNLLQPGFFNTQDNMHPLRLLQYEKCREDGQFPCRYVQQLGLNCGYPLFNFYSPASYEFALGIRTFTLNLLSILSTLKAFYFLSTFIGIFGMFSLSSRLSKHYSTALLATSLYALAPYKSINLYVRGAMAEYFLLAIIPWTIYFLETWSNCFIKRLLYILFLALAILSHNLFSLLFGITFLFFFVHKLWSQKKHYTFQGFLIFDTVLAILLTTFFLVPAVFERIYTTNQSMSTGYFNFINHFVSIKQLFFSTYWGFGPSVWGNLDGMSFQIGPIHVFSLMFCTYFYLSNKNKFQKITSIFLFLLLILQIFLTHNRSTFLWQLIHPLAYIQFPWRFLGPITFLISILVSILIKSKNISILLLLSCLLFYARLFYPGNWDWEKTDQVKFTGEQLFDQQISGIGDYWPSYGRNTPSVACQNLPIFLTGGGLIQNFYKKSNMVTGNIIANTSSKIKLPLVYFPGWQISVNQSKFYIPTYESELGLITLDLPSGINTFKLIYMGTSLQHFSNYISLFCLLFTVSYLLLTTWPKK